MNLTDTRGDYYVRKLHREWVTDPTPDNAMALLQACLRRGMIQGLDCAVRVWDDFVPATFGGRKQANASVALASDGVVALKSYSTVVAIFYPMDAKLIWSPDYAHSSTSSRHVGRWHACIGYDVKRKVVSTDEIDQEGPSSWKR